MRITAAIIREVEQKFATGLWSQRRLSDYLGIARYTVRAIVLGKFAFRVEEEQEESMVDRCGRRRLPSRCKGCGGLVHKPCRLCAIRAIKSQPAKRGKR